MKTRILTACVCVPMAVAVLWLGVYFSWVFTATLLALCFIGIHEALKTAGADNVKIIYAPCFAYGAVVLLAPYITNPVKMYGTVMAASMIFLFVMFGILLKKHSELRIEKVCTSMILTMFVALPFMVLEMIFGVSLKTSDAASHALGLSLTVYCLVVAWMADIGAYFIGRTFGKHKLAPRTSPNKSWEGFIAGLIVSMCFWCILLAVPGVQVAVWQCLLFGLVCGLTSVLGDLCESRIKRSVGFKDSGTIMPGHGGLFDRCDSLMPTAVVAAILLFGFGCLPGVPML